MSTMSERVAKSISAMAGEWRKGNTGPMDAECQRYLTPEQQQRVEAIARISDDPCASAYDFVISMLAKA